MARDEYNMVERVQALLFPSRDTFIPYGRSTQSQPTMCQPATDQLAMGSHPPQDQFVTEPGHASNLTLPCSASQSPGDLGQGPYIHRKSSLIGHLRLAN